MELTGTAEDFRILFQANREETEQTQRELISVQADANKAWDKFYAEERKTIDLERQVRELQSRIPSDPTVGWNEHALSELLTYAYSGNKIGAIKQIRSMLGLGLKEAKDFVEAAQGRAAQPPKPYQY
jgi:ribosomal protein L7/L12